MSMIFGKCKPCLFGCTYYSSCSKLSNKKLGCCCDSRSCCVRRTLQLLL